MESENTGHLNNDILWCRTKRVWIQILFVYHLFIHAQMKRKLFVSFMIKLIFNMSAEMLETTLFRFWQNWATFL